MPIKIREKMQLPDGRYAALGGQGISNAIVIVQDGDVAHYHWSENSGKDFWLSDTFERARWSPLKVDQHARGIVYVDSVAEVTFCGQSRAQRECAELKRHLVTLGYLKPPKVKPQNDCRSIAACTDMGNFSHEDIAGFKEWFEQWHDDSTITWSKNIGDSQSVRICLNCPGYGDFYGEGSKKAIAKICAVNAASKQTGYEPM